MNRLVRLAPVAVLLASCVSPAWDDHDYALKAGKTAESAASTVRMVRTAVQHQDRLSRAYLKILLTETAGDLGSLNDQFAGVQPPSPASDRLRDQVTGMTERAESRVRELLIEVRRDRVTDPARAVRDLGRLADELARFAKEHR